MRPTTAPETNIFRIDYLLHPTETFQHPRDVLARQDLKLHEKRAILASWASDAAALASCPELHATQDVKAPVSIDDVLDALEILDGGPRHPPGGKPKRLRSVSRVLAA